MKAPHPLTLWRERNKVSQESLAEKLNVTRWTITSVETGRRKPSFALAASIERVTGISRVALRPDVFAPLTERRA